MNEYTVEILMELLKRDSVINNYISQFYYIEPETPAFPNLVVAGTSLTKTKIGDGIWISEIVVKINNTFDDDISPSFENSKQKIDKVHERIIEIANEALSDIKNNYDIVFQYDKSKKIFANNCATHQLYFSALTRARSL